MDALKILDIQNRYKTDISYTYIGASFDLIGAGCSSLEASRLLLQAEEERNQLPVPTVDVVFRLEFDWSLFIEQHQEDVAEYKIGTMVEYIGDTFPLMQNHVFKILASNVQDDEHTEYRLEGFPYLVYGDEIRPAQVRPENCHCLDATFEALGCMCQERRMSG